MDYVATHQSRAPRMETYHPGTLGRVAVHYSATTMCRKESGKDACRRRRRLHAWRRASNLRPPGRSTRALAIYYATDVDI